MYCPMIDVGSPPVWLIAQESNSVLDLIESEELPPPVAIGSIEGCPIVTILSHPFHELSEGSYVIPPGEHPDGLYQMEEWIGVSARVE